MDTQGLRRLAVLAAAMLMASCASLPSPAERRATADALAAARQWKGESIRAGRFDLMTYVPSRPSADGTLTVYIEGDGLAWITPDQPSDDPTPREPLGLQLALAQPAGTAAYLARPCQYVQAPASGCASRYWTAQRFAPEVIDASDEAVSQLKAAMAASRLVLVGYSGGANIAALVAARRSDVMALVTVAGNLDPEAWTRHHHLSPLGGSLSAADALEALGAIPQVHLAGGRDAVVPPSLLHAFAGRFPVKARPVIELHPDFTHRCCWANVWAGIYRRLGERWAPESTAR